MKRQIAKAVLAVQAITVVVGLVVAGVYSMGVAGTLLVAGIVAFYAAFAWAVIAFEED